jgi:hypothetical protein
MNKTSKTRFFEWEVSKGTQKKIKLIDFFVLFVFLSHYEKPNESNQCRECNERAHNNEDNI